MEIAVGINGYGRIGRAFHRQMLEDPFVRVVAINSRTDARILAHLLRHDSIYGQCDAAVTMTEGGFSVDGQPVAVYQESRPGLVPWGAHGVDVVVEATGQFRDTQTAGQHLNAGVRGVILCCPSKDAQILPVVIGINEAQIDLNHTPIISNSSCTTNALASMLRVLDDTFGVEFCSFRTIHAITDSQRLLDNADKDPRRARAAMESIIPTSTGASLVISRLFPHLNGRVHGLSYRVPTRCVSSIDLSVRLGRPTTVEQINHRFTEAARGVLRGILGVSDEPLVSIDFKGDTRSVIVDLLLTTACGGGFFNLVGWYDNEWGYSARLVDLVRLIAQREQESVSTSMQTRGDVPCVTSAIASA